MSSSSHSLEAQDQQQHIIADDSTSRILQLAKMFAVVAIPVVALVIICSLQLSSAVHGYNAADAATAAFQEYLTLDKLVTGVIGADSIGAIVPTAKKLDCDLGTSAIADVPKSPPLEFCYVAVVHRRLHVAMGAIAPTAMGAIAPRQKVVGTMSPSRPHRNFVMSPLYTAKMYSKMTL